MPLSDIVERSFGMKNNLEAVAFLRPTLDPIRISYDEIVSATNNFADDNLMNRGRYADVYKAKLLRSNEYWVDVVIRRYTIVLDQIQFLREIQVHSELKLKHRNVLSIVGFCDENYEKIMVFEYQHNGSLDRYLSDPTALTWSQRLNICLGAASLLAYVHENNDCRPAAYPHRYDIKSSKILLDRDWEAKVFCFGLSIGKTIDQSNWKSIMTDVYAFGVMLFEVICGKEAEDESFVQMAKQRYEEGKLDDMIHPDLRKQMDQLSLWVVSQIAYHCLHKDQKKRPVMNKVVEALQQALTFLPRVLNFKYFQIELDVILSATKNFDEAYCIGEGGYGKVYKAELYLSSDRVTSLALEIMYEDKLPKNRTMVAIKRIMHREDELGTKGFLAELELLNDCENPNILRLLGFCVTSRERILVYEHASNGSLNDYLNNTDKMINLMWGQRLKICLGIAYGLNYLHKAEGDKRVIIHRDIRSDNILLDENLEVKIVGFGLSLFHPTNRPKSTIYTNILAGTFVYDDPEYLKTGRLKVESNIYSFGVILFEVICGKEARDISFVRMAKQRYEEGKLDDMIHPDLRKQMDQLSLWVVSQIAYHCLHKDQKKRPVMNKVVEALQQALTFLPRIKENRVLNFKYFQIELDVILSATKNFNEEYCIGEGGYGKVYKAELYLSDRVTSLALEIIEDKLPKNRTMVAIKRIMHREDELGTKGFLAELELLNDCENPNILRLLGFCVTSRERILVYEHASSGSLNDYLNSTDKMINLMWGQRLKMCLGIAYGLSYLHKTEGHKRVIIHRDIKSDNILLDENLEVKIADFGLSLFHPTNHPESTIYTNNLAGTNPYADPEYFKTGKLKVESDIYSFGVVLFEILSGKLAYDSFYTNQYEKGIAPVAREHFSKGTIKEMVDGKLMNEAHELSSTLKIGPDQHSLDTFCKVAYKCLAETQVLRPKMKIIIEELEKALHFQENRKDTLKISPEDIRFDGENFGDENCNISRGFDMVYNGEVQYGNGCKAVAVKRLGSSVLQPGIWREFEIPFKHRHENIIALVGYCKKMDEKFIVYEHASNQSLDVYINDADLSWTKRLKICIDIANGLDFLHRCDVGQEVVIHRDMKSSNILLTGDWKAKISGFEVSRICSINQEIGYVADDVEGSPGYCDPLYRDNHFLTKESDIYSFGVILFEVLCGRLACWDIKGPTQLLVDLVKHHHRVETLEEIVFDGIKKQIVQKSLFTFQRIAIQCLHDDRKERPTAGAVLQQLQKALEFQEDFETWKNKLPINYIEILKLSNSAEVYSIMGEKDIYTMFCDGISLQDGKLWFSIGSNGERNEMISATTFSYKNRWSRRWQSIQISRFKKVAEMLDVANLNIQIRKTTQLLLPGVNYSIHLVFKFCGPRKSHADQMYVNLKYKMGKQNLNAYFATWRNDGWMTIELCRFSNQKEETNVDVLLQSFSRCYCDSRAIYIEGIEFRSVDNVKQEEIQKSEKIQKISNSKMDESLSSMTFEIPAEQVLYDTSNKKLSLSNLPFQSRSEGGGIELRRQQVFRIKCNIESQMGSPNTKGGVCYLVFKLSESCSGLHCPVIVRDQSNRRSKETAILYFRSPSPWNLVATHRVPKKRGDGWMEVIVGIFNSDFRFLNLKLSTYEGTVSGLIVRNLEFRPS